MERVLEPEIMNDDLQVKEYAQADFEVSNRAFLSGLDQYLHSVMKRPDSRTLILDFGCGPGKITKGIANLWPSSRVIGLDGSQKMLDIALRSKNESNPPEELDQLSYRLLEDGWLDGRLTDLEDSVDVIVSNSFLHHLHDPSRFWKFTQHLTSPGTVHFHRDLRRPSSLLKAKALQEKYLPEAPPILIRDYLASLQAAFTTSEILSQVQLAELDFLKVFEVEDRYLDVLGNS